MLQRAATLSQCVALRWRNNTGPQLIDQHILTAPGRKSTRPIDKGVALTSPIQDEAHHSDTSDRLSSVKSLYVCILEISGSLSTTGLSHRVRLHSSMKHVTAETV